MVKSWANSATRRFAEEGKSKFAGLDGEKAEDLLAALNAAGALSDLSLLKSVGLHKLTGDRKGQWAMTALAHLLSLRGRSCVGPSRSSTIMRGRGFMKAIHPGRVLRRELESRKMSANALKRALRTPSGRIVDILNGKRGISPETALRLARFFGASAMFWLNLQTAYELAVAEETLGERIAEEAKPSGGVTTPSTDEARAS